MAEKFWILLIQKGKTLIRETPEGSGKWVAEYNGPEGQALFQMYVDLLKQGVDSPNIEHDAKAFETHQTTAVPARVLGHQRDRDHGARARRPLRDRSRCRSATSSRTESMFVPTDAAEQGLRLGLHPVHDVSRPSS